MTFSSLLARRPLLFAGGGLLFLVILWLTYWITVGQVASYTVARIGAGLEKDGHTVACVKPSFGGFPFRLDFACDHATLASADQSLSAALDGVTATAPLYRLGHVEAALVGPFVIDAPEAGLALSLKWQAAHLTADAGFSGFKGADIAFDGLELASSGTSLPFQSAAGGAARLVAAPSGADYGLSFSGKDIALTPASGASLPTLDLDLRLTAVKFGSTLGGDPPKKLAGFLAGGGVLKVDHLSVAAGGTTAEASGTITASPEGKLSGKLIVTLTGLSALADIAEALKPGSRKDVERAIKALGMVTVPVKTDKGEARQTVITISQGVVLVGIIPLATIPPLKL